MAASSIAAPIHMDSNGKRQTTTTTYPYLAKCRPGSRFAGVDHSAVVYVSRAKNRPDIVMEVRKSMQVMMTLLQKIHS